MDIIPSIFQIKKASYKIILSSILLILHSLAQGQDFPFVDQQYIFSPQILNPAIIDTNKTLEILLLTNFNTTPEAKQNTYFATVHYSSKNDKYGAGINYINDHFASESFSSVTADISYNWDIGNSEGINFGIRTGFAQYKNQITELLLYPDWIYDPAFENDIDFNYIPIGFGIHYYTKKLFIDVAYPQAIIINNDDDSSDYYLKKYLYISSGYDINLTPSTKLIPMILINTSFNHDLDYNHHLDYNLAFQLDILNKIQLAGMFHNMDRLSLLANLILYRNIEIGYSYNFPIKENIILHFHTLTLSLGINKK